MKQSLPEYQVPADQPAHKAQISPTPEFKFKFRAVPTTDPELQSNDLDALDTAASASWHALTRLALSIGSIWPKPYKPKKKTRPTVHDAYKRGEEHRIVPPPLKVINWDLLGAGIGQRQTDISSSTSGTVAATEKSKNFRFLDLPPEIRNEVYTLLLSPRGKVKPYIISFLQDKAAMPDSARQTPALHPNLLRVSKQLYHEAASVLYRNNVFEFSHTPAPFINPICRQFDSEFSGWTTITNLNIRHIKPLQKGMPHMVSHWVEKLTKRLRIRQMPNLQTLWLEFPLWADWAKSPQAIILPIMTALQSINSELEAPFSGYRTEKLQIVSVAWMQAFRNQVGWNASTTEWRGTVCIGLVAGDLKAPPYFSVMKELDMKVWSAEWGNIKGLKVPWIWKGSEEGEGKETEQPA